MTDFTYAHNDTGGGERKTATAQFNRPKISEKLRQLRTDAFSRGIPTADDETLNFLTTLICAVKCENILELGTAVGISGAAMLMARGTARLITIEREQAFYNEAVKNFAGLNLSDRATVVLSDAGEYIRTCTQQFDFIFLDSAKVQYVKYLPHLKRLLKSGGILLADDVLLYGWITGETEIPQKRKMLARHVKEYIDAVLCDDELTTTIINLGDGLAFSVKK